MKNQFKGLKNMKKMFRISLMAISLVLISCEIPENLNDNPNVQKMEPKAIPSCQTKIM